MWQCLSEDVTALLKPLAITELSARMTRKEYTLSKGAIRKGLNSVNHKQLYPYR